MSEQIMQIDTADTVLHRPTGETWIVAYVKDGRLAWVGWPEGEADLSDCELVKSATDDQRLKLLRQMALMQRDDARARYARKRLGVLPALIAEADMRGVKFDAEPIRCGRPGCRNSAMEGCFRTDCPK